MDIFYGWLGVGGSVFWVSGSGWRCILGGWVCGGVGGGIFWVGGSELG